MLPYARARTDADRHLKNAYFCQNLSFYQRPSEAVSRSFRNRFGVVSESFQGRFGVTPPHSTRPIVKTQHFAIKGTVKLTINPQGVKKSL